METVSEQKLLEKLRKKGKQMKKTAKVIVLFYVMISILISSAGKAENETATTEIPAGSVMPRHAPNMYVDWIADNEYDIISVDWYCERDALNTYWAVHNWDCGYAGFQNKDGNHVLLLSLWDLADGTQPEIEYVLDGQNGTFDGEGTGKQVFTNYAWKADTWYTMCIKMSISDDKTYYEQYIKEEGGEWLKTAVISYPVAGKWFYGSSMFQEDFAFNNLMRSCRLRNACARVSGTDNWELWNRCIISNSFFPTDDATWDHGVQLDIHFNCHWEICDSYVFVQSGGEGFETTANPLPADCTIGYSSTLP